MHHTVKIIAAAAVCAAAAGAAMAMGGASGANVTYAVQGHIGEVVWNPYKIAPLTAVIRNGGYVLTDITVRIVPKEGGQEIKYKVSDAQARTHGGIPVFGLYGGYRNTVEVSYTKTAFGKSEKVSESYKIYAQPASLQQAGYAGVRDSFFKVNVKKVEQISSNIAMNLSAPSIRVLAPIPGRNVVGVEVPNTRSEAVYMRAVMETDAWNGKAAIPIVLGKDVASKPVVLDLAKAPHLLIAGSTGSGKSVCMNTLIMSLLFKFNPDDLRLIMVDPKIVEFEDYKKLPHLITPVINDAKKVPIALRWAVTEMENRYKILARAGVKKLAEFNALSHNGEPILDSDGNVICDNSGEPLCKMPILIVIIDELAELRMQDSWKDSETYIARIAQLGRASGVHIVVATQRPSTNIITGVIKANLPTRIAFRVMQLVDSRVILDVPGAENLLGMGDMLYLAPGGMNIERVQGALVDDKDIKAIVKFVSEQRPQNFNAQVVAEEEAQDEEIDENMVDDYDEEDAADIAPLIRKYLRPGDDDNVRRALEVVLLDRKASTSYLQRRLKIGYNRAAEIIDLFEERGIVGPPSGSGNKREILVFDEAEFAG